MPTTFTHTPAHSTCYPDHFEDETDNIGYDVYPDPDAEDPRTWTEDEHACVYVFNSEWYGREADRKVPENIAAQAFARFYGVFGAGSFGDHLAKDVTRRWLSIFHPEKQIDVMVETVSLDQSSWRSCFAAVEDGYGAPQDHIDEFIQWARGDVWVVDPDNDNALGGIYAETAEDALAYYRKMYENEPNITPAHTTSDGTPIERDDRPRYGVFGFDRDDSTDTIPDKYILTIAEIEYDEDGEITDQEEIATIVHRALDDFPIDGEVAQQKLRDAHLIVDLLNEHDRKNRS